MFSFPIEITSVVSAAATVASSYAYSKEIDLTRKWFDNRRLTLRIDVLTDSASGELSIAPAISARSGSTFTNFVTVTGTSLCLTGGTSTGGEAGNGTYVIPLTISPVAGSYDLLTGVTFLKFGFCASYNDIDMSAYLMVG